MWVKRRSEEEEKRNATVSGPRLCGFWCGLQVAGRLPVSCVVVVPGMEAQMGTQREPSSARGDSSRQATTGPIGHPPLALKTAHQLRPHGGLAYP